MVILLDNGLCKWLFFVTLFQFVAEDEFILCGAMIGVNALKAAIDVHKSTW